MDATSQDDSWVGLLVSIESYVMILVQPVYDIVSGAGTILQNSHHWISSSAVI
jgi:hypothetical protein